MQETAGKEEALRKAQAAVGECKSSQARLTQCRDELQDERKALWRADNDLQTHMRELLDAKKRHEKQVIKF